MPKYLPQPTQQITFQQKSFLNFSCIKSKKGIIDRPFYNKDFEIKKRFKRRTSCQFQKGLL